MSKVKLLVVAGVGGARADFTAGWLGTLPGFVNSRWLIDPTTGVSYGHMGNLRAVDHGANIHSLMQTENLLLDPWAEFTWAVAVHGFNLKFEDYKMLIFLESIKFVSIDVSNADQDKIAWEFFVKTFLSHRRTLDSVRGQAEHWVIDSSINKTNITDSDRIEAAKQCWANMNGLKQAEALPGDIPSTKLDYVELFKQDGSRYLCEQLNITAPEEHHRYWNAMLPLSDSPTTLDVWGHTWHGPAKSKHKSITPVGHAE